MLTLRVRLAITDELSAGSWIDSVERAFACLASTSTSTRLVELGVGSDSSRQAWADTS